MAPLRTAAARVAALVLLSAVLCLQRAAAFAVCSSSVRSISGSGITVPGGHGTTGAGRRCTALAAWPVWKQPAKQPATDDLEKELLDALAGMSGRGKGAADSQRERVDALITALEQQGGVRGPACDDAIDGTWRLLYTSTPGGTASPIQRSFTAVDAFSIYQNIELYAPDRPATVTNVVDFGDAIGRLDVAALASTARRPLPNFVPRRGNGRFFGLNVLGVSLTAEEGAPADPAARIDFKFDDAGFDLKFLPFRVPYPVPFRYLGDEVKGWIDITFLSRKREGGIRIARGNKGTTFVLVRE